MAEEQKIKLEKVDDKAAYENLLIKYAELKQENKKLQRACKKWFDKARENKKEVVKLLAQMKCCGNCLHQYEGSYKNGIRCKDHLDEEVCNDWELFEGVAE